MELSNDFYCFSNVQNYFDRIVGRLLFDNDVTNGELAMALIYQRNRSDDPQMQNSYESLHYAMHAHTLSKYTKDPTTFDFVTDALPILLDLCEWRNSESFDTFPSYQHDHIRNIVDRFTVVVDTAHRRQALSHLDVFHKVAPQIMPVFKKMFAADRSQSLKNFQTDFYQAWYLLNALCFGFEIEADVARAFARWLNREEIFYIASLRREYTREAYPDDVLECFECLFTAIDSLTPDDMAKPTPTPAPSSTATTMVPITSVEQMKAISA